MAIRDYLPASFPAWPAWRRYLLWGAGGIGAIGLIAFVALLIAVFSTQAKLPSFGELKSSPNGQMIRVHAADGTVLVSLGPSYGEWIDYDHIPQVMKDAIISIEDQRFESHWGVDAWGVLRAMRLGIAHSGEDKRMQGASTITQQVARNDLPVEQVRPRPQDARGGASAGDGAQVLEARDPRALSQQGLFRRRRLRHRCRRTQVLRPSRRPA